MDALFQALSRSVDAQQVGALLLSWSGRLVAAPEPEPALLLLELGDSSVNIAVRPRVNTRDHWPVRSDLLERIKHVLESNGLSIPFPQRDVHIVSQTAAGQ
jgi:small conductance mechanosensitive channel